MYEATFRIQGAGTYADATAGTDTSVELWCNDHCDLLHVEGSAADETLARVDEHVGVRDSLTEGDDRILITDACLKDHESDYIEQYLTRHGCLLVPPITYARGAKHCRILALDSAALTAFYRDLVGDYHVTVESKRELQSVADETPLGDGGSVPELSPRQREVLLTAHDRGYYEIPREVTTADIAGVVGVERRTAEEHLRRAERKIVDSLAERIRT